MRGLAVHILAFVACVPAFGRVTVVLPAEPTAVERSAAAELADGVFRMTGTTPETVAEGAAADGLRLYVGATEAARALAPKDWKYDEVLVAPVADGVVCAGHPERGAIYAVDTYLERVCGVRWWTSTEDSYPTLEELPRPAEAIRHAPVFAYRETYYLDGYRDARFKVRSKGNFSSRTRYMFQSLEPVPPALGGEHRLFYYEGRGSAYHSYFEVLPPAKHFAAHPEWYSLVDGKRQAKQLCLTNPEMKKAYIDETLRLLRTDPGVDMISVSQNDWDGACQCAECRRVIDDEGAVSGLTLRFANEVAEAVEREFPNVIVDTFAYRFTVEPPRKARPRHNVTVRLCCIDSGFNEPLATRRLDDGFTDQLARWAEIAPGRLYIWDYVTNYHQYMLPHPNIRVLAPNIRQFAAAKATGVLSLGDALCPAGSLAAFKHWYVSHLLWDPSADADALRDDFLSGYYGKGAAAMLDYIDVFEEAGARLAARGRRLRYAYSNYADGFVTPEDGRRAREALDRAEQAAETPVQKRRVRRERLGLDLAFILNHDAWAPSSDLAADVEKWIADCGAFGVEARRETVDRGEFAGFCAKLRRQAACGALRLGQPFSDGMVLQRGLRVPVWGRATPGNAVTVSFAGQTLEAPVEEKGYWRVALQPLEACAEGRMLKVVETVAKAGLTFGDVVATKEVMDVLVGEVWLASGQSNMECPIWGSCPRYRDAHGAMAVAMTHKPLVRFVKVGRDFSLMPKFRTEKASGWKKLVPSSIDPNQEITFSAVAFYFALELHNALGIPVGIVDASYGGTNIDAWTPRCAYANCDPALKPIADYPLRTKEEWTKERDALGPIDRHDQQPTIIYNAMVAPFAPMAVRGFLWYQGCENAWDKPQIYCTRLQALYNGWSTVFERPDLSMLMVHLAPWCNWMSIWREQNKFAAEEPNCALAVAADIGNPKDIHPADKLTVARRLAFQALKRNYGFPIPETDAPTIKSVVFDGNKATLTFDHVKRWYFYSPDKSEAIPFEMAGEDGKWHPAKFENDYARGWNLGIVSGSEIHLSCEQVSVAKRVRYMGTGGGNGTLFSFETSLPLTPFER